MEWENVAIDFEWDGSLRDIYVLETSPDDWQAVVDALRSRFPEMMFEINGQRATIPSSVAEVLSNRSEASPLMSIETGGIIINCHFFGAEEIEFDLDPRQITSPAALNALAEFLRLLGKATQKDAFLTPENASAEPILHYSPESDEVKWVPWKLRSF